MTRIIALLLMAVLLGFVGYFRFHQEPLSPRQSIEEGVQQVLKNNNLTSEQQQLLRVQLALADYMANTGEAPETLDRLVPKYFDELPKNPASGKAFPYYRNGKMPRIGVPPTEAERKSRDFDLVTPTTGFINPNVVPVDQFVYDKEGRRDPFEPFDISGPDTVIDPSRPEIEQVPLGSLRLAATIRDSKTGVLKAVVETAQGRGYTVVVGSRVGMNQGVVTIIDQDVMKVLETETDFTGKQTQSLIELKINRATDAERVGGPASLPGGNKKAARSRQLK